MERLFSSNIILEKTGKLLFIFLLGLVFNQITNRSVNLFFSNLKKNQLSLVSNNQRLETLRTISNNIISIIIFFTIILITINELGFNVTPILTGAGLLGLAISFGAQTLIKDLIAGFFIILENQYNVGDLVKIGESQGKVYKITLKATTLKDKEGNLIYISNSEIKKVILIKKNTW